MKVDIRGVNTHNKGAHLMLIAVAKALGDVDLATSPNGSSFKDRASLGLEQTFILNQAARASAHAGSLIPGGVKRSFGVVSASDLDGVLDAAGFAYSDSFGIERSKREAKLARYLDRRGVPRVFLPQAFGPFNDGTKAEWSRRLLEPAKVVFARDRRSLAYLKDLSPDISAQIAPDFTVGLPVSSAPRPIEGDYFAVVPNAKVVSHSDADESLYVDQLVGAAQIASASGLEPVVVVHEFSDRALAGMVQSQTGARVFEHSDPLVLKRALSDARLVLASRFHAVVSSLSSETPVVAFGWSHKYEELMADFGVPEFFVSDLASVADRVRQAALGDLDRSALASRVDQIKKDSTDMWSVTRSALGVPPLSE